MTSEELKHLAPYLPYGLKYKGIFNTYELTVYNFKEAVQEGKPILRPLSDLKSLGDKNIPINSHTINQILGYGEIEFSYFKGDLDIIHDSDSDQRYDSDKTISFSTFETIRTELLKGHYDIFGLIDAGLAIDINTLQ